MRSFSGERQRTIHGEVVRSLKKFDVVGPLFSFENLGPYSFHHSKIDNLVQIGLNVVIGQNCMLCGQVGVAGSVTIGDYVTLGGRVAIRDHVSITSKVRLAANSCVTKDIREPGDYGGFPAVPINVWRRQVATLRRSLK